MPVSLTEEPVGMVQLKLNVQNAPNVERSRMTAIPKVYAEIVGNIMEFDLSCFAK